MSTKGLHRFRGKVANATVAKATVAKATVAFATAPLVVYLYF